MGRQPHESTGVAGDRFDPSWRGGPGPGAPRFRTGGGSGAPPGGGGPPRGGAPDSQAIWGESGRCAGAAPGAGLAAGRLGAAGGNRGPLRGGGTGDGSRLVEGAPETGRG